MNLKVEMLKQIFIKTGGREENPKIVDVCAEVAEKYADEKVAEFKATVAGDCFWRHKWSKWEQYKQDRIYPLVPDAKKFSVLMQKRVCLCCNKMEIEKVWE